MHLPATKSTVVHMHLQQSETARHGSGAYALVRLPSVPNQPKNKNKPIRVSEELWARFGEACAANGSNRAAVIRAFMERYVRRHERQQAKEKDKE